MAVKAGRLNHMPGIIAPGDVRVIQPGCFAVSESPEQPSGMTPYSASSRVVQGGTDVQKPGTVNQNPAGVAGYLQSQPTGILNPAEMAPGMIQYAPGTTIVLPPGDPQSPLNAAPGPTQTSNQPPWNMSFVSFQTFNPEKLINEEVRTPGAVQILIGLVHIFSGINPLLYEEASLTGLSGYPFWGGISFIVSGSLSVCAEKNPNTCMVNGSVGMNIVSTILSLVGILILITDMSLSHPINLKVLTGSLLPFALLEFFLTCVVSHFGCKANCWTHFENMTVISTISNFNPANMTTGHANAPTSPVIVGMGPANPPTGPANLPTSLASPPYSENIPPEPSHQNTAGYAQS